MVHKIMTTNDHENLMKSQQMFSWFYNSNMFTFWIFRNT